MRFLEAEATEPKLSSGNVAKVKVVEEQERHFDNEDHLRYTVDLDTFYRRPYINRKQWLSHHYNPRTINIFSRRGDTRCDLTLDVGESYIVVGSMGVYDLVQRFDDLTREEKLWLRELALTPPKFD
ncbi:hypothetical protein ANCDUO_06549 [Ancylostoma duodenale]|uniref:Uncharacterized protein n=1 Tax=Ancylostoma duodenale TaxID=51022 RepID=A0A0C2DKR2_9BILA|nr:hypothetical protein ANCDUO_06549 [Ancylostoma duodenale]